MSKPSCCTIMQKSFRPVMRTASAAPHSDSRSNVWYAKICWISQLTCQQQNTISSSISRSGWRYPRLQSKYSTEGLLWLDKGRQWFWSLKKSKSASKINFPSHLLHHRKCGHRMRPRLRSWETPEVWTGSHNVPVLGRPTDDKTYQKNTCPRTGEVSISRWLCQSHQLGVESIDFPGWSDGQFQKDKYQATGHVWWIMC